MVAQVMRP